MESVLGPSWMWGAVVNISLGRRRRARGGMLGLLTRRAGGWVEPRPIVHWVLGVVLVLVAGVARRVRRVTGLTAVWSLAREGLVRGARIARKGMSGVARGHGLVVRALRLVPWPSEPMWRAIRRVRRADALLLLTTHL